MKKVFAAFIVLSLVLVLCSCGDKQAPPVPGTVPSENTEDREDIPVGIRNPVTEYSTLDEINGLAGTKLVKIESSAVSDERYSFIEGGIAQYEFDYNGLDFTFRASADTENDISGVWIGGEQAFSGEETDYALTEDAEIKVCRFIADGIQYTVSVNDGNALGTDEFDSFCSSLMNAVKGVTS